MSGRLAAKHAIKEAARHAAVTQQAAKRATVTSLNPLTIEVFGFAHPLTADNDFELSQWAKLYDALVGIAVDDLVLMVEHDEWVLQDVVSNVDVVAAFRQARA